ncbi:nucleoside phosphorylase [Maribacter hydrothermalis]|uniref:Phosphorylase n=1 Tax=Maribacter hydrothermalis TaxID=1836467 RepID=A0A1B7Z888_9FLAO|nr:nucleoside phosphorylase [Maribacter hydrothermalis]APQ19086.1 phosphorylase [Maribacter hydrothermalis]OBR38902.1 phosphorylase [Maribacter hydrothermalis]
MQLRPAELIINEDGSIYHLNLLPEDIATTIITVGDPDRVNQVSSYFDSIEVKKGKREFLTHTGHLNGKRISVISTGIGTDNIDIVINELDALVNIDFKTRALKKKHTSLKIVRIGTSGAIQNDIPVDSFLMSEYVMGFDGLLHFYEHDKINFPKIEDAFIAHTSWDSFKARPYVLSYSKSLGNIFKNNRIRLGFTATNTGFYGPQQRQLRLKPSQMELMEKLSTFSYEGNSLTNLEMETSGIYALSQLLGHEAVSMNCILANRANGEFSKDPVKSVDKLINFCLERLT